MPRIATTNPTIAPEWNRASRYGAALIIIICTVIALRPLVGGSAVGRPRPVTPATTHPRLPATCAGPLKGRFVFISDGMASIKVPALCTVRAPVLQSV